MRPVTVIKFVISIFVIIVNTFTPPPRPASSPPSSTPGISLGPDLTSWTFWWTFNRDRFISLIKETGKAIKTDATEALTAIASLLPNKQNRDVITTALLSTAKISNGGPDIINVIKKYIHHEDQIVREEACLALGILGDPAACAILTDIFVNGDPRLKPSPELPPFSRTRTFVTYAIGLIGAKTTDTNIQNTIRSLMIDFLEGEGTKRAPHKDLRIAVITTLGMVKDPEGKALKTLQNYFNTTRKREEIICTHAVTAIARLLRDAPQAERGAYVEKIVTELSEPGRSGDKEMRQSMAQAIGILTHANDPFAQKAFLVLKNHIDNNLAKNQLLAYFGMIAIGEMAGTGEPGNEWEQYLITKAQAEGGRVMTRAWAALALGVEGYKQLHRPVPIAPNVAIGKALREMINTIKDPEQLGAFALAIGLIHYTEAKGDIATLLNKVKSYEARGHFATALGLMGADDKDTKEQLDVLVKNGLRRPDLFQECALAAGMLKDDKIVPILLSALDDPLNHELVYQAMILNALALVGDPTTIIHKGPPEETLPKILIKRNGVAFETRAFIADALGMIYNKDSTPWNLIISRDINYTATVETLNDDGSQTGILNIR